MEDKGPSGDIPQRIPGGIILGRAETAADDDYGSPIQGLPEHLMNPLPVVPDRRTVRDLDPDAIERLGEKETIGIDQSALEELGANTDDLCILCIHETRSHIQTNRFAYSPAITSSPTIPNPPENCST